MSMWLDGMDRGCV